MKTYKNQVSTDLKIDCGSGKTIGIVKSLWNQKITDRLYMGCVETLLKYHVQQKAGYASIAHQCDAGAGSCGG